jgi:hypothetical protein
MFRSLERRWMPAEKRGGHVNERARSLIIPSNKEMVPPKTTARRDVSVGTEGLTSAGILPTTVGFTAMGRELLPVIEAVVVAQTIERFNDLFKQIRRHIADCSSQARRLEIPRKIAFGPARLD